MKSLYRWILNEYNNVINIFDKLVGNLKFVNGGF